ncbi:MAG: tetratricopeptide repeat protein [Bacteroidales bacterium]|jgi:tetratricopeptide (TPR) repeat protein
MAKAKYNKNVQPQKNTAKPQAEKVQQPALTVAKSSVNLPAYLLFGFAFLLYANSLFNQYALDDRLMITENSFTKKGFSGIKDILTTDSFVGFFGRQKNLVAGGRYRPLSHITFAMEYGVLGFNPFVGHLINVLMYAFSCLLVYKVLKMLFPPGKKPFYLTLPFIATALFIAHPLHTEAIDCVKGRDEIMSLLGSFGALYYIIKYVQNSKPLNLLWATIVFFLGLMSKENAITFVVVVPLTLYFFTKSTAKKTIISTACLLAASVAFIIIRTVCLGSLLNSDISLELLNNPFLDATVAQKYATILLTWGKFLILLVFPHPLTHDYYPKQIPIIGFGDIRAILPFLLYLAMFAYALWRFKKKEIIAYCILFYGITFSIQSNLVFPIGTFMNERFMFIPLLGFCIIIAYLFTEKVTRRFGATASRNAVIYVVGGILLLYSVKTIARNPVWYDDYTLFTTDVKTSANSAKCNVSAGGQTLERSEKEPDQMKKKKMIADAIAWLNKGISIHPKYVAGWLLLGKAMIDLEDYKASRQYYETALQISPGQKEALNNWLYCAQVSAKNKDYSEAEISYRKLIQYQPENNDLWVGLAGVYEYISKIDSVIVIMNRLLAKNPNNAAALSKIGEMYGKYYNNLDKSIEYLMKAYAISPTDASLLENLGVAYGLKKDFAKSIEFFNKALAAKPDNPQVYMNLAGSYANLGDKQKAEQCKAKAIELQKVGSK